MAPRAHMTTYKKIPIQITFTIFWFWHLKNGFVDRKYENTSSITANLERVYKQTHTTFEPQLFRLSRSIWNYCACIHLQTLLYFLSTFLVAIFCFLLLFTFPLLSVGNIIILCHSFHIFFCGILSKTILCKPLSSEVHGS